MKKYLMSFFALILAVSLSAFNQTPKNNSNFTDYYWYEVDYSVPGGQVAANTPAEFGGSKLTQPDAQQGDDCADVDEIHCLRGFAEIPDLSSAVFTYDSSTPKEE